MQSIAPDSGPSSSRHGQTPPDDDLPDTLFAEQTPSLLQPPQVQSEAEQAPVFTSLPVWLQQELRSDHAGEVGAVMIYRGILAISRDASVRQFAEHHLATEQQHLQHMEYWVPAAHRTRLLPVWWVMGWLTGALPALFGRQAIFATIEAVETFVDQHYEQQVARIDAQGKHALLRQTLVDCQADEVSHRDEAAQLALPHRGPLMRCWCAVVGVGSAAAVVVAKRV